MFNKVISGTLHGVDGRLIVVEADVSDGLPMFNMVGFLASEVREASDRVRTALKNSDFHFSPKKITINLSPADVRKEGSAFDLPISIALLSAYGYIPADCVRDILFIGELSLNGDLKGVRGILSIVDHAKKQGIYKVILPFDNRKEAAIIPDVEVYGARNLKEAVEHLIGNKLLIKEEHTGFDDSSSFEYTIDFSDVKGQNSMKRATEIAVAGMHNLLFVGPPGAGKSMIAKRIPTIMPELDHDESVELTKIYSAKGMLSPEQGLIRSRPFRTPHHSITAQSLIGGGMIPKPGEISLSHHGVLFLDEMLEFNKNTLEMLRQPIEDGRVTISRIQGSYTFPCNFMLVAAMNPCPCGYYPDRSKCHCTIPQIERYIRRLSQPMLDRMDMCLQVKRIEYKDLCGRQKEETSGDIKKRIVHAKDIQRKRLIKLGVNCNSQIPPKELNSICMLGEEEVKLIEEMFEKLELTARGMNKILKVSRTIADLDDSEEVTRNHILEALSYRINDFMRGEEGL
ncbi:MAG: YifB family Mg chelatase-like AAA ATPase [Lachnospiraceae bacterium]|nr:YifB family Mg chelatase-like AAA ATPase [Lachnospiraceae bacterium]